MLNVYLVGGIVNGPGGPSGEHVVEMPEGGEKAKVRETTLDLVNLSSQAWRKYDIEIKKSYNSSVDQVKQQKHYKPHNNKIRILRFYIWTKFYWGYVFVRKL